MSNTSNLEEFEKQLNESTKKNNIVSLDNVILSVGELKENAINTIEESFTGKIAPVQQALQNNSTNFADRGVIKVQKNFILAFQSDNSGCGFIRCNLPFSYLQFLYGRSQTFIPQTTMFFVMQPEILMRARTLYFQRTMAPEHVNAVRVYKQNQQKFKYKMVWEMDDHIFWEDDERKVHGVPPYNLGGRSITEHVKNAAIEIMKMMDLLIVTTEFMKYYIHEKLKVDVPIHIVPNYAAKFFWKGLRRPPITAPVAKPKFIYTGSPTHYDNETRQHGDWENPAWRDFIIKNVNEGKISFTCMGGLPWFFEGIRDKIKIMPWVNSHNYHMAVLSERADFGLMPLVPNNFNRSKSDLKMREYYAAGVLAIGCYFDDKWSGPYGEMSVKLKHDCSIKDIEDLVSKYRQPDLYNKTIKDQFDWMDANGGWLESKMWIDNFVKALT